MTHAFLARALTLAAAIAAVVSTAGARADEHHVRAAKHVVLISVDGLHQSDLSAYVATHANSTLAKLVGQGASYTNARTPFPSDSFPGLTALVTGGNPRSTGVYYDDSWNRTLLPAGTTSCAGVKPGTEVTYFEQLDYDFSRIDAGYGAANPGKAFDISSKAAIKANIPKLPGQARDLIDPSQLPVDPVTCKGVYPHAYLRVNTVFEVAKGHGLHTAWSDKHAAYDLVNGPSGAGVDDLFAPEINSDVPGGGGDDWTKDNLDTQFYDALKVDAVVNWANGKNHDGSSSPAGAPAIYGMNFQSVSTAQKLNFSHYLDPATQQSAKGLGGYVAGGSVAGPVVAGALDFVDQQLARIVRAIDRSDTVLVLSAKHAQSPLDRAQLRLIDDGEVTGALNDAWAAAHPEATDALVSFSICDDAALLWLSDRSPEAARFARDFLWSYTPAKVGGSDADGKFVDLSGTVQHSGLRRIYSGEEASEFIGVRHRDDRVPDVIGIAAVGTVYSNPTKIKKISEHGGDAKQDRHVPIVVWGAGIRHESVDDDVETTQIAPTILRSLGLHAPELDAVRIEHTEALPGIR
jgi:hypothetical protein